METQSKIIGYMKRTQLPVQRCSFWVKEQKNLIVRALDLNYFGQAISLTVVFFTKYGT
jgi:hypothetical protein